MVHQPTETARLLRRGVGLALAVLLLAGALQTGVAVATAQENADSDVSIESAGFNHTVSAAETSHADGVYVWRSQPNVLRVTYSADAAPGTYEFCAAQVHEKARERIGCAVETVQRDGPATVQFPVDSFSESTGNHTVRVTVKRAPTGTETLDSYELTVDALAKSGDRDGDGLSNQREVAHNTSMFVADTDGDGLQDGPEVTNYRTSPTAADTDDDGLSDAAEIARDTSPTDADTDGDGIPDGVEVDRGLAPKDATADTDDDGLTDAEELEWGSSPVNADTDGDLLNDGVEHRLGTDPRNAVTFALVVALVTTAATAIVVGGWYLGRRFEHLIPGGISRLPSVGDLGPDGGRSTMVSTDERPPDGSARGETNAEGEEPAENPLLSDQDRVIQLLQQNDGWLYQSDIVDRTHWSKSKVSRLLSEMADEGRVEKISVGRQNVVTVPDAALDGLSPFEG